MISKKQDKNYDNDVSTFDLSLALFIASISIIAINSAICIGTMLYTNLGHNFNLGYNFNLGHNFNLDHNFNFDHNFNIGQINKNLFTGIWHKVDSNNSNLHIYQNDKVKLKNGANTKLVDGYINYNNNTIYINYVDINKICIYNISYIHFVNNAYSFTILYDNTQKIYHVYRKYDYVVNIAFINKILEILKLQTFT